MRQCECGTWGKRRRWQRVCEFETSLCGGVGGQQAPTYYAYVLRIFVVRYAKQVGLVVSILLLPNSVLLVYPNGGTPCSLPLECCRMLQIHSLSLLTEMLLRSHLRLCFLLLLHLRFC